MSFIESLIATMDRQARTEFGEIEQEMLLRSMRACGMESYPPLVGSPAGEHACGDCLCDCGREYFAHPMDWRMIGYGNVPFLNVLCDGRRVKL